MIIEYLLSHSWSCDIFTTFLQHCVFTHIQLASKKYNHLKEAAKLVQNEQ